MNVVCSGCGGSLSVGEIGLSKGHGLIITVLPCRTCKENARVDGYKKGKAVGYFRGLYSAGVSECALCGNELHNHGWVDTPGGGYVVCPGDPTLRTNLYKASREKKCHGNCLTS